MNEHLCLYCHAQTLQRGEVSISVDAANIDEHDSNLYSSMVCYPAEVLPLFDSVFTDLAVEVANGDPEQVCVGERGACWFLQLFCLTCRVCKASGRVCWYFAPMSGGESQISLHMQSAGVRPQALGESK